MSALLLRLAGPMQSWGTQSRFRLRDTGLEPSKSGVIGLLCAALGRPREDDVDDLTALQIGVRVDQEGIMRSDYHTAGAGYGVVRPDGTLQRAVLSTRYYLSDAVFLVGLGGERGLLETLDAALARPRWQLFLGRKSFVPGAPVRLPDGLSDEPLLDALMNYRWLGYRRDWEDPPQQLRLVLDAALAVGDGLQETRMDVPISFADRRFTAREVRTRFIDHPARRSEVPA